MSPGQSLCDTGGGAQPSACIFRPSPQGDAAAARRPSRRAQLLTPAVQMRYIAAYLLLVLGGKKAPTSADVAAVLSSAGVEVDQGAIDKLVTQLQGKVCARAY